MYKIISYRKRDGEKPFWKWLEKIKDRNFRARIRTRLDRLILGNFGDCKRVGQDLFELRFHFGPGYRVYYGMDRFTFVVLLLGGDKGSQSGDIDRAQEYWKDYLRRKDETLD